ncbi:unnamed protein product [Amoebophrya sp. A120]|nr:unnamed protein product [Amoebophrya sp. A120]|eukprot:GSA120T00001310001.1
MAAAVSPRPAPPAKGIVIIPLGGLGTRFKKQGFPQPKGLVPVEDKPILFWLLDGIHLPNEDWILCIPYNTEYKEWDFENRVKTAYPNKQNIHMFPLETQTRGAAETLLVALEFLEQTLPDWFATSEKDENKNPIPVCSIDADSFYTKEFDAVKTWGGNCNAVFSFQDLQPKPIFSYVEVEAEDEEKVLNPPGTSSCSQELSTGTSSAEQLLQHEIRFTSNKMRIKKIVEKEKISDWANSGVYAFKDHKELMDYVKQIIERNIRQKNEYYTSTVIQLMLADEKPFFCCPVSNKFFYSLGTPEQVAQFQTGFLLDLDGTLVKTDEIYVQVWNRLLQPYGLSVDQGFFETFIKGKSDLNFLKYLMPEAATEEVVAKFATDKDTEFVKTLEEMPSAGKKILIPGVEQFLQKIKNARIAVVTSCNRTAAEFILKITNLADYVTLLICSEDCGHHKPHPEPYQRAMSQLQIAAQNCVIIEDSSPGLLAASRACVSKVCFFTNGERKNSLVEEAVAVEADVVFDEWDSLDVDSLFISLDTIQLDSSHGTGTNLNLSGTSHSISLHPGATETPKSKQKQQMQQYELYAKEIHKKLSHLPVKDVQYSVESLKTGYICDINAFKVLYTNGDEQTVVFKISNFGNELSKVATQLDMYEKEGYFYEHLAEVVSATVSVPKSYGVIRKEERIGIIMEDLRVQPGVWNCDLNQDIQLLLNVTSAAFRMHDTYLFEKREDVIPSMANLVTPKQIVYYQELVKNRFPKFINRNGIFMSQKNRDACVKIAENYEKIAHLLSTFPLSFVHGDLKSPNIFYQKAGLSGMMSSSFANSDKVEPVLCDWQYIHLNKGVSDIAFLLVESIKFDAKICNICIDFYYHLWKQKQHRSFSAPTAPAGAAGGPVSTSNGGGATANGVGHSRSSSPSAAGPSSTPETSYYELYLRDFKLSLCLFPYFVMVWFNSEDSDKLIDKSFPIRFMKNLLDYYTFYLDLEFFEELEKL